MNQWQKAASQQRLCSQLIRAAKLPPELGGNSEQLQHRASSRSSLCWAVDKEDLSLKSSSLLFWAALCIEG